MTHHGRNNYAAPAFWQDLEARFRKLQPDDPRRDLIADWISTSWDDEGNQWVVHGSYDRRTQTNFERLAERAALRIGHGGGPTAVLFWLDLLRRDSPNFRVNGTNTSYRKDSKGILGRVDSDIGTISRLCEASADYCVHQENREIARSSSNELNPTDHHSVARNSVRNTRDIETILREPRRYPTMTVDEVSTALKISKATVYRMLESGGLKRSSLGKEYGTRRAARITTDSVLKALEPED